jgi:hypothetical protein
MKAFIYVLRHPETHQIHYVGKTNILRLRRKTHEQSKNTTRVSQWVQSLRAAGLRPEIEAIEEVPQGVAWQERERYWIAYYRTLGCDLLNTAAGGGGGLTHGFSNATRERLRQAFKGRPMAQEQRAQISKALTGKKQSAETVAKRRATISANRAAKGLQPWNYGRDKEVANARARELRRRKRDPKMLVMGSPEWKEKIRQTLLKRNAAMTPEERKRIFAATHDMSIRHPRKPRGPMPEEHKEKIRQSLIRTKARQKQERLRQTS